MPEMPVVSIEPQPDAVYAVVHRSALDDVTCNDLQREVLSAATQHATLPMLLDLTEVKYVPSMGLGTLVMLNRKLKDNGQRFVLVGVQSDVRNVLSLTRLDQLFEMHADRAAALAQVRGTP
jgi:anti-sigma B factor antagonist